MSEATTSSPRWSAPASSTRCSVGPDGLAGLHKTRNEGPTMTQETQPAPTPPTVDPNAPVVHPQAIYIKDCSFEAPNGPFVIGAQGTPGVSLNLATRATPLSQDVHEIVLQVNLEAKVGDK